VVDVNPQAGVALVEDLILPLVQQRDWAHDQRRLGFGRWGVGKDEGEHLDRLAESHVVGQDPAPLLALLPIPEPVQPRILVR